MVPASGALTAPVVSVVSMMSVYLEEIAGVEAVVVEGV